MPSILIVDQQLLIRLGLRQMLSEEFRGLLFGEAKSEDEATKRLSKQPWNLVILATGPNHDGVSVLEKIRRFHPSTRVLILGMHAESEPALHAQRLGAAGYVCKNAGRAELLRACRTVLGGGTYFENLPPPGSSLENAPQHAELSTREYQVLIAFAAGRRSSEIAADLNLSAKTVGTYKCRILDKLRLRSNADLIRYAITHRLA